MKFKTCIKEYDAVVVGSGCAGLNAADTLYDEGLKNIALVTEGMNMGTSLNTGSDKQTYYKLSLSGDYPDSIESMAKALLHDGVDGHIALCEAAGSVTSFMKLVRLGVDFPYNDYGEYIGYKTDHDPANRGTSLGPLTSNVMTKKLQKSVKSKNIDIIDKSMACKLIVKNKQVLGIILYDKFKKEFFALKSSNIILCTGGPGQLYKTSVFPKSQTGMSGMPLLAGAKAVNLSEWQYGMASTKFRWNVSGSYMQVLPRFISIDSDGVEREFLRESLKDEDIFNLTFLKGYQWPFDYKKVDASSKIDILVYEETAIKERRVYLDFRKNPTGLKLTPTCLSKTSYDYLASSDSLDETPILRLNSMNPKAIDLYKNNGIDLYKEALEIKVCAQHHNGGIMVDSNWQTSIKGLYAAGEVAGTFGTYRPGGSALNSTQVGSMRAAKHISYILANKEKLENESSESKAYIEEDLEKYISLFKKEDSRPYYLINLKSEMQSKMSKFAAHVRDIEEMEKLLTYTKDLLKRPFFYKKESDISRIIKFNDILIVQATVLSAMIFEAKNIGSRASYICKGPSLNKKTSDKLVTIYADEISNYLEKTNEIPTRSHSFEKEWRKYREKKGDLR